MLDDDILKLLKKQPMTSKKISEILGESSNRVIIRLNSLKRYGFIDFDSYDNPAGHGKFRLYKLRG